MLVGVVEFPRSSEAGRKPTSRARTELFGHQFLAAGGAKPQHWTLFHVAAHRRQQRVINEIILRDPQINRVGVRDAPSPEEMSDAIGCARRNHVIVRAKRHMDRPLLASHDLAIRVILLRLASHPGDCNCWPGASRLAQRPRRGRSHSKWSARRRRLSRSRCGRIGLFAPACHYRRVRRLIWACAEPVGWPKIAFKSGEGMNNACRNHIRLGSGVRRAARRYGRCGERVLVGVQTRQLGVSGRPDQVSLELALRRGYFEQEGLDVETVEVDHRPRNAAISRRQSASSGERVAECRLVQRPRSRYRHSHCRRFCRYRRREPTGRSRSWRGPTSWIRARSKTISDLKGKVTSRVRARGRSPRSCSKTLRYGQDFGGRRHRQIHQLP